MVESVSGAHTRTWIIQTMWTKPEVMAAPWLTRWMSTGLHMTKDQGVLKRTEVNHTQKPPYPQISSPTALPQL